MTYYNTDAGRWINTSTMEPKALSPDVFARLKIYKNVFMPKMCLRPGLRIRPSWGSLQRLQGREETRGRGGNDRGEKGPLRLHIPIPGSLFYPSPPLAIKVTGSLYISNFNLFQCIR